MEHSLFWRADSRLWNSKFYYWFTGEGVSTCSATSVSNLYPHTCFVSSTSRLPMNIFLRSLFHDATARNGPGAPHYRCFTITHSTFSWTPLDERSSRRGDLYLITHNTHKKDVHAPGGDRPLNPSKRAAADPHIRACGHWDLCSVYRPKFCVYFSHHHMCYWIRSPLCQVIWYQ
jgi:hypothetical protein